MKAIDAIKATATVLGQVDIRDRRSRNDSMVLYRGFPPSPARRFVANNHGVQR